MSVGVQVCAIRHDRFLMPRRERRVFQVGLSRNRDVEIGLIFPTSTVRADAVARLQALPASDCAPDSLNPEPRTLNPKP